MLFLAMGKKSLFSAKKKKPSYLYGGLRFTCKQDRKDFVLSVLIPAVSLVNTRT